MMFIICATWNAVQCYALFKRIEVSRRLGCLRISSDPSSLHPPPRARGQLDDVYHLCDVERRPVLYSIQAYRRQHRLGFFLLASSSAPVRGLLDDAQRGSGLSVRKRPHESEAFFSQTIRKSAAKSPLIS